MCPLLKFFQLHGPPTKIFFGKNNTYPPYLCTCNKHKTNRDRSLEFERCSTNGQKQTTVNKCLKLKTKPWKLEWLIIIFFLIRTGSYFRSGILTRWNWVEIFFNKLVDTSKKLFNVLIIIKLFQSRWLVTVDELVLKTKLSIFS